MPKTTVPEPFGKTWDEQDAALRAPVSVLPDEEQVSDPEEDIDPELELEDGRTVDADGVISEPEAAPMIEFASRSATREDAPAVQCFATVMKSSLTSGASGVTWAIDLQVDPNFADDFATLVGEEHTCSLILDKYEAAKDGVRVKSVVTAERAQEKSTRVSLHITEDQRGLSGPVGMMVGQYVPMELYRMQLTLDLTSRAE